METLPCPVRRSGPQPNLERSLALSSLVTENTKGGRTHRVVEKESVVAASSVDEWCGGRAHESEMWINAASRRLKSRCIAMRVGKGYHYIDPTLHSLIEKKGKNTNRFPDAHALWYHASAHSTLEVSRHLQSWGFWGFNFCLYVCLFLFLPLLVRTVQKSFRQRWYYQLIFWQQQFFNLTLHDYLSKKR